MKQIFTILVLLVVLVTSDNRVWGQTTTVTTGIPSSATSLLAASQTPGISFIVSNTNSFPMILTSMQVYRDAASSGKTWTLYYSATSLSGLSAINTAAGWTQIATAVAPTATSTGIYPVFTSLNFQIPGNTIYRFYVCHSGDIFNYGGASTTPNNFSNGGITIGTGNYQIGGQNVGHAGYSFSLSSSFVPRFFGGTLTFQPGSANNLHGLAITQPLGNSDNCHGAGLPVRVKFQNTGSAAQSNFQVGASYSGTTTGTVSGIYTGTLAPGAVDSIDLGPLSLQPGNYNVRAYTMLSTDTLNNNDTTGVVSFFIKQPVAAPVAISDTVCLGDDALCTVDLQPGVQYRWYSSSTGGSLVHVGNNVSFTGLTQDTTMYVAALENGCESSRMPIHAAIGPPPVVELGSDTSFCESIPLILNAGNPGGIYTWSTGDSTQAITITDQSGVYWVTVDKYCITSDTVEVTIAPMPSVNGISYVRMANEYHFTASNAQDVDSYFWEFGDGATSTLPNPVHTFGSEIDVALNVKLTVTNNCGSDTVGRIVPTSVSQLAPGTGLKIYPNPASERLRIETEHSFIQEVSILDIVGKKVVDVRFNNMQVVDVDVNQLPPGSYIVRSRIGNGELVSTPLQISR